MEQQHTIDIDEREHRREEEEEECSEIEDQNEMNSNPSPVLPRIKNIGDSDEPPCIFRVHEGLRHANEKAYTPMLVSIGPYHHGQPKLLPMEKHKERYLELLLRHNNQTSVEPYLASMKKLEQRARKYYANPIDKLDSDEFVKMMLHDACFVAVFLLSAHHRVDDDPIVKVAWMRQQIFCDLILLENQLPFFVISEFLDMSFRGGLTQNQFLKLAMYPIIQKIPRKVGISRIDLENTSVSESKHFLDLVHNVYLPSSRLIDESNNCHDKNQKTGFKMPCVTRCKHFLDLVHNVYPPSSKRIDESNNRQDKNQKTCFKMPCVIELKDAGVKFKIEDGNDERNLKMFDIHFEHGCFKIPKFRVTDSTETFFRNIIAYEQHSSDDKPKYFTDYTYFMDLLINSKEDVKQLRHDEVLENWLGDEEEVALMFNKLGQGRIILNNFYYSELCSKVNTHCKTWWNRVVATLKRDYFKNIWVTVATFAATFLLLLTIVQTVIALITIVTSSPTRH